MGCLSAGLHYLTTMCTVIGTNKKQSLERKTFLLQVRFAAADAKIALQTYIAKNPLQTKTPLSKNLVKEVFFHNTLGCLPRKGVEALAEFLFTKSLQNEYILPVPKIWPGDEQEYIVSPEINEKRPGPRKKR